MSKKKLNLTLYADPGHGWLAVKLKLLSELGILSDISRCSFMRGKTAYLEEGCDAGVFMDAARHAGYEVTVTVKHTDKYHRIRNYPIYFLGYRATSPVGIRMGQKGEPI